MLEKTVEMVYNIKSFENLYKNVVCYPFVTHELSLVKFNQVLIKYEIIVKTVNYGYYRGKRKYKKFYP